MSSVNYDISMSLDGYVRAANPRPDEPLGVGGEALHDWAMGPDDAAGRDMLDRGIAGTGAMICGRATYDDSIRWWGADGPSGQARLPLFVVTHAAPSEVPAGGVYVFVTTGIEDALAQARAAAGGKAVSIMGGPDRGQPVPASGARRRGLGPPRAGPVRRRNAADRDPAGAHRARARRPGVGTERHAPSLPRQARVVTAARVALVMYEQPNQHEEAAMRFMVLVPGNPESEAGVMPSTEELEAMTKYNEELVKAGVMLAGDGLHPSSKGARCASTAASAPSSTARSPRPRSSSPATGSGSARRARRRSSGSSARRSTAAPRSSCARSSSEDFGELTPSCAAESASRRQAELAAASATQRAIDAVWRIESARLIAGLTRIVRDVAVAEDLAQDALVAALEQWPQCGHPGQPRRLADGHRQAPRHRRAAPPRHARAQAGADRARAADPPAARPARPRRAGRRRAGRRAAPGLHDLPPGPLPGGARGADAAPARRPLDAGDRARVPRLRGDGRAAHRPRQAHPRRGPRAVRGPGRDELADASPRCSRSSTWSSTRATPRPPASTGSGRRCARTRCAWAASSPP